MRDLRVLLQLKPKAHLFFIIDNHQRELVSNTDPQTGVALGGPQGRNVRSNCRCSMCPAIHIISRSWLRSSSTHEPSDPPLGVVWFIIRKSFFIRGSARGEGFSPPSVLPRGPFHLLHVMSNQTTRQLHTTRASELFGNQLGPTPTQCPVLHTGNRFFSVAP